MTPFLFVEAHLHYEGMVYPIVLKIEPVGSSTAPSMTVAGQGYHIKSLADGNRFHLKPGARLFWSGALVAEWLRTLV